METRSEEVCVRPRAREGRQLIEVPFESKWKLIYLPFGFEHEPYLFNMLPNIPTLYSL